VSGSLGMEAGVTARRTHPASVAQTRDALITLFRQEHPDREVGPQSRGSRGRDGQVAEEEELERKLIQMPTEAHPNE